MREISGLGWAVVTAMAVIVIAVLYVAMTYGPQLFAPDGDGEDRLVVAIATPQDLVAARREARLNGTGNDALAIESSFQGLIQRLTEELTNSRRLAVVERDAIREAAEQMKDGDGDQDQSPEKSSGGTGDKFSDLLRLPPEPRTAGFSRIPQVITAGWQSNLTEIRDTLDIDYLLIADTQVLRDESRRVDVPYSRSGGQATVYQGEVLYVFRLVDMTRDPMTVTTAASFRKDISQIVPEGQGVDIDAFALWGEFAREISNSIMDVISPATVASVDPLVITRGSQDGVQVGDEFTILREGREIRDTNGILLGRVQTPIGSVRVIRTQPTISRVEPVEQTVDNFQEGDMAAFRLTEEDGATETDEAPAAADPSASASRSLRPSDRRQSEAAGAAGAGDDPPSAAPDKPTIAVSDIVILPRDGGSGGSVEMMGLFHDANASAAIYLKAEAPSVAEQIDLFTDRVVTGLVQTRRFRVFDRQQVDQLLQEQTFTALSDNTALASVVGTLEGVDYLTLGVVDLFEIEREERRIDLIDRELPDRLRAQMRGTLRIVHAGSGEIVEAHEITVNKLLEDVSLPLNGASTNRLTTDMASDFARKAVILMVNGIFPIKVAVVGEDGTLLLNRGRDGGLFNGEVLKLYRPSGQVIDQDTGIDLGPMRRLLGEVEIQEAEDFRSFASISDAFEAAPGDIAVRFDENKAAADKPVTREQTPVRVPDW